MELIVLFYVLLLKTRLRCKHDYVFNMKITEIACFSYKLEQMTCIVADGKIRVARIRAENKLCEYKFYSIFGGLQD